MPDFRWVFDPAPPSGSRSGGLATAQIITPSMDNFVREVLQNSHDQQLPGQKTTARFTFIKLTGEAKAEFLEGLGWNQLRPHVEEGSKQGGVTIGPQLGRALQMIDKGPMTVLRIDDSGTVGLAGEEDETQSNFNLLCRHMLVTSEEEKGQQRGGSFGIGKSVLWRCSLLSTVLVSSRVGPEKRFRFFGRTELPFHGTSGKEWTGPGWYGLEELKASGMRAISVWDGDAEGTSRKVRLFRPVNLGTGCSILVVGFFEPQEEEERDLKVLAKEMANSAARWFWPSLAVEPKSLEVVIEVQENGNLTFKQTVGLTPEVTPFVEARTASVLVKRIAEPGDVAESILKFNIPKERSGKPEVEANFKLRVRLAKPEDEGPRDNEIALFRGAGMVVRYKPGRTPLTEQTYHAMLIGGRPNGDSQADNALERFLRACEPPSHNEWLPVTERLRFLYESGAQSRLGKLWKDLDAAILEIFDEKPPSTSAGPKLLAALFPLTRGKGGGGAREKFKIDQLVGSLREGKIWEVGGRVRYQATPPRPWSFSVTVWLDAETGSGVVLPLAKLKVDEGTVALKSNRWECTIPADVVELRFSGETAPPEKGTEFPDLRRTRIRLQVTPRSEKAKQ